MINEWKEIQGYEGLYEVNNQGDIKSLSKNTNGGTSKEKILKKSIANTGYAYITLYKNSKPKRIGVHRLVALAFIYNPNNKPCVNHKDGNKENNETNNLEWVTHSENRKHAYLNGFWSPWNKGKHIKCNSALEDWQKKGGQPWNKGKKDIYSEEYIKKLSDSHKGQIPWNKPIENKLLEVKEENETI